MDRQAVYARTNKGHKEVAGRTTFLKHSDRSVLFLITGKESLTQIESRIDPSIAKRLDTVIQRLVREEFIYLPEPQEISAVADFSNPGRLVPSDGTPSRPVATLERTEASIEMMVDSVPDDVVNAVLKQAKDSSRRQELIERMRRVEAAARKKAAAPSTTSARGMVLPAKRLQAAFTPKAEIASAEPALDPKRILARSGKGALEFIGRTCTLSPALQKILAQVDGVSTIAEIQSRIGRNQQVVASGIHDLLKGGYVQDSVSVLDGLEPEVGFDADIGQAPPSDATPERVAQADLEAREVERATLADVWRELAEQQRRELAAQAEEAARQALARVAPPDATEEAEELHRPRVERAGYGAWTPPQTRTTEASDASRDPTGKAALQARLRAKRRMVRGALVALVLACVAYVLWPLFDTARYEVAARDYFGERVRIGSAGLSIWPRPAVKFSDVRIGEDGRGIRIDSALAKLDLEWLVTGNMVLPLIEIDGATVTTAELRSLLRPTVAGREGALTLRRIQGQRIHIVDPLWKLNDAKIDAEIGRAHNVRRMQVTNPDGSIRAQFLPAADGLINFELNATKVRLFGAPLTIDQLDARGTYASDEVVLREFDGRLFGGVVHGQARIRQGTTWSAEGTVEGRGLDLALLAKPLFDEGVVSAKARFKSTASAPHELFTAGTVEGSVAVDRGTFTGADIARVVLREESVRGTTVFTELTGTFNAQLGARLALSNVRFKSNRIAGVASAQVEHGGILRAQVGGSLWTPQGPVNNTVDLSGTLKRLVTARRE